MNTFIVFENLTVGVGVRNPRDSNIFKASLCSYDKGSY
jgi:hypothetical protein